MPKDAEEEQPDPPGAEGSECVGCAAAKKAAEEAKAENQRLLVLVKEHQAVCACPIPCASLRACSWRTLTS
jgi:hypothetical protein